MTAEVALHQIVEVLQQLVAQNDEMLKRTEARPDYDERLVVAFERIATALERRVEAV